MNATPRSVCERLVQNIGRNVWGYVRDEWVWSPAGAAYSLTQSVSESEQSPPPAPFSLLLAHLLIPLRAAYIGQYDLLSSTMYRRMYAQHRVSSRLSVVMWALARTLHATGVEISKNGRSAELFLQNFTLLCPVQSAYSLLELFNFLLLYTSTALHSGGKTLTFYTPHLFDRFSHYYFVDWMLRRGQSRAFLIFLKYDF